MEAFTYFGDINYFVTKDNYLYDIDSNKLISNNKVDKIYKSNDTENCNYNYLIIFDNNETAGIGSYRCS